MSKKVLLLSAAFLLTSNLFVASADSAGSYPNVVYGNLGLGIPLSSFDLSDQGLGLGSDSVGTVGLSLEGGYRRMVNSVFGVGVEVGGFLPGDKTSTDVFPPDETKASAKSFVMLATARANIPVPSNFKLQPYALAGIGFHNTSVKLTTSVRGVPPTIYDSSGLGFAMAAAGGLEYSFTDHFFVGGELRYEYLSKITVDPTPVYRGAGLRSVDVGNSNFSLLATTGFKF